MKKIAGRILITLVVSSLIVTPVYATPSVDDLKEDKAAKPAGEAQRRQQQNAGQQNRRTFF